MMPCSKSTFGIIKPDIVGDKEAQLMMFIEKNGFLIRQSKTKHLSVKDVEFLYYQHRLHPNFLNLIEFMCSGPSVLLDITGKENTIRLFKQFCGYTNPESALSGTIRGKFGSSYTQNAIHASANQEEYIREYSYFSRFFY